MSGNSYFQREARENLRDAWRTTAEAKLQLEEFERKLHEAQRTMFIPPCDLDSERSSNRFVAQRDSDLQTDSVPFSLRTNTLYSGIPSSKRRFMHEERRKKSHRRYLNERLTSSPMAQVSRQPQEASLVSGFLQREAERLPAGSILDFAPERSSAAAQADMTQTGPILIEQPQSRQRSPPVPRLPLHNERRPRVLRQVNGQLSDGAAAEASVESSSKRRVAREQRVEKVRQRLRDSKACRVNGSGVSGGARLVAAGGGGGTASSDEPPPKRRSPRVFSRPSKDVVDEIDGAIDQQQAGGASVASSSATAVEESGRQPSGARSSSKTSSASSSVAASGSSSSKQSKSAVSGSTTSSSRTFTSSRSSGVSSTPPGAVHGATSAAASSSAAPPTTPPEPVVAAPPPRRRRPVKKVASAVDARPRADSPDYRHRQRPYSSTDLRAYMGRKKAERRAAAERAAASTIGERRPIEYDRAAVGAFMKRRRADRAALHRTLRERAALTDEQQRRRLGDALRSQKRRSRIPTLTLVLQGCRLAHSPPAPEHSRIDDIRTRHARRTRISVHTDGVSTDVDTDAQCRLVSAPSSSADANLNGNFEENGLSNGEGGATRLSAGHTLSTRFDQFTIAETVRRRGLPFASSSAVPVDIATRPPAVRLFGRSVPTVAADDNRPPPSPPGAWPTLGDAHALAERIVARLAGPPTVAERIRDGERDTLPPLSPPTTATDGPEEGLLSSALWLDAVPPTFETAPERRAPVNGSADHVASSQTSSHSADPTAVTDSAATDRHSEGVAAASTGTSSHQTTATATGRLSPRSLRLKLVAGLNYLEVVEESLKQLTDVDRVREVATAHQQTLAAGHLAKALEESAKLDRSAPADSTVDLAHNWSQTEGDSMALLRAIADVHRAASEPPPPPPPPPPGMLELSRITAEAAAGAAAAAVLSVVRAEKPKNWSARQSSGERTTSTPSPPTADDSQLNRSVASQTDGSVEDGREEVVRGASRTDSRSVATQLSASAETSKRSSAVEEQLVSTPPSTVSAPVGRADTSDSDVPNSWRSEAETFGGVMVREARAVAVKTRDDSGRRADRRRLLDQRNAALKNYFAAQIAFLHARKRRLAEESPRDLEARSAALSADEDRLVVEYRQAKQRVAEEVHAAVAQRDFAERQLREITRLQALTMHQQLELDHVTQGRQSGVFTHSSEVVPAAAASSLSPLSGALSAIKHAVDDKNLDSARQKRLDDRRRSAERLLRVRRELERREAEVAALERRAVGAWFAPPSRIARSASPRSSAAVSTTAESSNAPSVESSPRHSAARDASTARRSRTSTSEAVATATAASLSKSSSVAEASALKSAPALSSVQESVRTATAASAKQSTEAETASTLSSASESKSASSSTRRKSSSRARRRGSWSAAERSADEESLILSVTVPAETTVLEGRIAALRAELRDRRNVAAKLKMEVRRRTTDHLVSTEQSLNKQLQMYERFITETQGQLDELVVRRDSGASAATLTGERPPTPPRIGSPRRSHSSEAESSPRRSHRRLSLPSSAVPVAASSSSDSTTAAAAPSKTDGAVTTVAEESKVSTDVARSTSTEIPEGVELNATEIADTATKGSASVLDSVTTAADVTAEEEMGVIATESTPKSDATASVQSQASEDAAAILSPTESASKSAEVVATASAQSPQTEAALSTDLPSPAAKSDVGAKHRLSFVSSSKESATDEESTPRQSSTVPEAVPALQLSPDVSAAAEVQAEAVAEQSLHEASLERSASASGAQEDDGRTEDDVSSLGAESDSQLSPKEAQSVEPERSGGMTIDERVDAQADEMLTSLVDGAVSDVLRLARPAPLRPPTAAAPGVIGESQLNSVMAIARSVLADGGGGGADSGRRRSSTDSSGSPRSPLAERYMAVFREPAKDRSPRALTPELIATAQQAEEPVAEDEPAEDAWIDDEYYSPRLDASVQEVSSVVADSRALLEPLVADASRALWPVRMQRDELRQRAAAADSPKRAAPTGEQEDSFETSVKRESERAFRQFVWDWSAELTSEIYCADETVAVAARKPWQKLARLRVSKFARSRPQTQAELARLLTERLCGAMRLGGGQASGAKQRAQRVARKKADAVDEVLLEEMYEEENEWICFDREEEEVKLESADQIFSDLLNEAVHEALSLR